MKIAIVTPRYGIDIIGGAEYHARKIAEHLSKFHRIEVLTTCASDYISWKNELKEGTEEIRGVHVRRFRNSSFRNMQKFMGIQEKVFYGNSHTKEDELLWVKEQGPYSPDLIKYIQNSRDKYDVFIFTTFRYFTTFYGLPLVPEKSILLPLAEDDSALNLNIFKNIFESAYAIVFNSPEEKILIERKIGKLNKINDTVGCGIELFPTSKNDIKSTMKKFSINRDFILYLGRIDGSKGCYTLFDYYTRYQNEMKTKNTLVMAGIRYIPIPNNPSIRFIGPVSEVEKSSLLKSATLLIMPSNLESLSLVTLEAMLAGIPVLVNGSCEVLKGHCIRSNGGLWYENYDEFKESLDLLISSSELRKKLGKNGKKYVKKNYSWNLVERKYHNLIENFQVI